ncbi:MAG: hemin uptake protein HemP [Pseudomonadota bacterium]
MSTKEMFGDRSEIEIEHDGSIYRLRITKQGKLILNK